MFWGREKEIAVLRQTLSDDQSHFIAVYGRCRVGKTVLIREAFNNQMTFQHAGLHEGKFHEQLSAFAASLKEAGLEPDHTPKNWLEAFEDLKDLIRASTEKRKVIFIDELSWMDTRNSDLIRALEFFWNGWASARKDIILVVCCSATSWILSKVIHNKGGLYHRLTRQIALRRFSLAECFAYVRARGLVLNQEQVLQYYMIFGGIPYYWSLLEKGKSLPQNVDAVLFAEDSPLKDEFPYLYASIFQSPEMYIQIIRTLGGKKAGMTREELVQNGHLPNSGELTKKLDELESCGFIRRYQSYGKKKKNAIFQLIDFFTLFALQFLDNKSPDPHFWENQWNQPAVNTWMGLAFERVCLEHVEQIRHALSISGVLTNVHSWYCAADPEKGVFGSQIDLLIVRNDRVINLFEMKYSETEYIVTSRFIKDLNRKISDLRVCTVTVHGCG